MNLFVGLAGSLFLASVSLFAETQALFESTKAANDEPLSTDPSSPFWRDAHPVFAKTDAHGKLAASHMEVRSRWTGDYLYFLFVCPYVELYLKPFPDTKKETNELWNWDVAEVFIGSDFTDIQRYKEFEISPQGEWVDLDINLHNPHHEQGWVWNSGFEHAVRLDRGNHVWYAAIRIPLKAIDSRQPVAGNTFRVNLFLSQGPPNRRKELAWQPPMSNTFHVPERFGLLKLLAGN
jgi:Carbohydrate family 9 binding domain-like